MAPANIYDVDAWTNPYTPRAPFRHLPQPIAHIFGHRQPGSKQQQPHTLIIWGFAFIGAFCGVALIEGVYLNLPNLDGTKVPIIIASFGASAVLSYNTIESPLAQPRNLVFGHFLSALTGVCITKLFRLLPQASFDDLRWLAGALSCAAASVVMSITKTVHPPAGATALLAATELVVTELGWWYLPLMLLGSMLMLASALIIDNLMRKYPVYWWTPADVYEIRQKRKGAAGGGGDVERATQAQKEDDEKKKGEEESAAEKKKLASDRNPSASEDDDISDRKQSAAILETREHQIVIDTEKIVIPDWLQADEWELQILRVLHQRVKSGAGSANNSC